jgi:tRNA-2-methylthio-N6-dimethylallyladenosine synthase
MTMSTDIIVGFPGETDDDFEATLSLVKEVGFTALFGFKYSPRPYTPSLRLVDDVSEGLKAERLARLFETIEAQGAAHLASRVGRQEEILFEGASKTDKHLGAERRFQGRTCRNEIVHVLVPREVDLTNVMATATITRANKHSLEGILDPRALNALPRVARNRPRSLPVVNGNA